jgi:sialic acid synthase SpsE|tara:strand:- start:662 stop:1675 length:1014 start_codon:yes stop_codon:yes gene_type:complete
MRLGNLKINNNSKTFIIAEIGINHGGSYKNCIKLISAAAKSGADAVKIQLVNRNESYQKGSSSFEIFNKKTFSLTVLKKIKKFCNKKKIIFFATPGDISSLFTLIKLKTPVIKISSGLMNNFPMIDLCIKKKIPIIISTGLATIKDLKDLKKFLNKKKFKNFSILKCTSEYPAQAHNLDLGGIKNLIFFFKCIVGYSDHYLGHTASLVAVMNGAKIIEKHFTLNKNLKGADHHISLEPKEFKTMVLEIRNLEKVLKYGCARKIDNNIKENRSMLRKLVVIKNIKKGDVINFNNIGFQRLKKKQLSLDPANFFYIKNKKSRVNLKKDTVISKRQLRSI